MKAVFERLKRVDAQSHDDETVLAPHDSKALDELDCTLECLVQLCMSEGAQDKDWLLPGIGVILRDVVQPKIIDLSNREVAGNKPSAS
jgi:hypothetical protein